MGLRGPHNSLCPEHPRALRRGRRGEGEEPEEGEEDAGGELRLPEDSFQLVGELPYRVGSGSVLKNGLLDMLLSVHDLALSKEHEVTVYPALYPLHHTITLGLPDPCLRLAAADSSREGIAMSSYLAAY